MIDYRYQKNNFAKPALILIIKYLRDSLSVDKINVNHRKENVFSGRIYDSLGFFVYNETDTEHQRRMNFTNCN